MVSSARKDLDAGLSKPNGRQEYKAVVSQHRFLNSWLEMISQVRLYTWPNLAYFLSISCHAWSTLKIGVMIDGDNCTESRPILLPKSSMLRS